jgi:hypothetical protein
LAWLKFRTAKEVATSEVAAKVLQLHAKLRDEFEVYSNSNDRRMLILETAVKAGLREGRDAVQEMREIQQNTHASFDSALRRYEARLIALLPLHQAKAEDHFDGKV